MEIKNTKLIKICDAQEGVNKKGDAWRKVTAVVETTDHYPKTLAITCFNSVCETVTQFTPGALINVTFDVESRSWINPNTNEERWFTEAIARMVVPAVEKAPTMDNFDKPLTPLNQKPEQVEAPRIKASSSPSQRRREEQDHRRKDDLPF